MSSTATALPALKYICGETENICRLCFSILGTRTLLNESRHIECFYCNETVTYADMLAELEPFTNPDLPYTLCEFCADLLFKAFLFKRLSQYSYNGWHGALQDLSQTIEETTSFNPSVKTAYLVIQENSNTVLKEPVRINKNKTDILTKVDILLRRKRYRENSYSKEGTCSICGMTMSMQKFYRHIKRQHGTKVSKLGSHLDKESLQNNETTKNVSCPKCDKLFTTKTNLAMHDRHIHSNVIDSKLCSKKSRNELTVSSSNSMHQCPHCSKVYTLIGSLRRHLELCADNLKKPRFWCDFCNKGFLHKISLIGHLTKFHGFGRAHTCPACGKRFNVKSALKVHMVKHTKERNFSCEECGNLFVDFRSLQSHKRLHTGEKPYTCEECGEKFLNASRRMDHKRNKHMSPQYECTLCDKKFKFKYTLSKHEIRHKNPQSKLYTEL